MTPADTTTTPSTRPITRRTAVPTTVPTVAPAHPIAPPARPANDLTRLLVQMQEGDESARNALFAACYQDLKRMAHARLRPGGRNTVLDTTGLVHDAYLRLVRAGRLRVDDRSAFFAYVARVMRSVIVDSARARLAERRGGNGHKMTLSTEIADVVSKDERGIVQVNDALEALARVDARLAQVVEMRYFGGYSETEIAESLGVNARTVQRDWSKARLILQALLKNA